MLYSALVMAVYLFGLLWVLWSMDAMLTPWGWIQDRQAGRIMELCRRADADPELSMLVGSDSVQLVREANSWALPAHMYCFQTLAEIYFISDNVQRMAANKCIAESVFCPWVMYPVRLAPEPEVVTE